jgi:hypothetical protein
VISKGIAKARLIRPCYCLLAVMLVPSSYSLLAQGTAPGGHSADEGTWSGAIHRQLCFVTADCGNADQIGVTGTAPIGIGSFTLSPRNAPTLVFDDSGAGTSAGNPIDIYTSNSTGEQAWSANNAGVTPSGFYNFATLGPFCVTASGNTSGSAVVLDPCAGTPAQAVLQDVLSRLTVAVPKPAITTICREKPAQWDYSHLCDPELFQMGYGTLQCSFASADLIAGAQVISNDAGCGPSARPYPRSCVSTIRLSR